MSSDLLPHFPENYTLCYHDPSAAIYDFWVDGVDDSGPIDEGAIRIPIVLDKAQCAFVLGEWRPSAGADGALVENLASVFQTTAHILNAMTGVYRRTISHPMQAGFTGAAHEQGGDSHFGWARAHGPAKAIQRIAGIVPDHLWDGTRIWFAPNSDPTAFGQFFLTSTADHHDVIWELRQVGINNAPIETAAWNDFEKLQYLWTYCQQTDPENLLTIQALENSARVRTARTKHSFSLAVRSAREAFARKKDQLRPRLSEQAVHIAMSAVAPRDRTTQNPTRAAVHLHDLTPYEVFGYRYQLEPLPTIYGAAEITFYNYSSGPRTSISLSDELGERFIEKLQSLLDTRKLGTLQKITYNDKTHLWLAKNLDLMREHHQAFGIPDDANWG